MTRRGLGFRLLALASIFWAGCAGRPTPSETLSPGDVFPAAGVVPGWAPAGDVETYDRETIFHLVDGQADSFFAYGFEQVMVQGYQDGQGTAVRVEVWQLATDADAYGLFTASIAGEPVAVGNEGDLSPGRRLTFWQGRHTVHVRALQEVDDAVLQGLAEAVAAALPEGGALPPLVNRLPQDNLVERGFVFFHQEISIQNEIWLGGENILGLSQETAGILARYEVDGVGARLLLVQYPSAEAASAGLAALQASGIESLVAADARGELLGAVLGELDEAAAGDLLACALGSQ